MKPPKSIAWFASLLIIMASVSNGLGQNETNRPAASLTSETLRSTRALSSDTKLSRWTADIVRLAQSGIDESVILAFVENSGAFDLAAAQIVQLNELGVPNCVISAMLRHDRELAPGGSQAVDRTESNSAIVLDQTTITNRDAGKPVMLEFSPAAIKASLLETKPDTHDTEFTVLPAVASQSPEPVALSSPNESRTAQPKKKKLYPVREPYPVELTAPIVFLDSPSF
ncbi:MAG: hypothetical protein U1F83_13915 [Verrucomicrobiota bacterium]